MSCLAPEADRVVRTAVEDYFAGRLRPEIDGETVFETRHSKYRLMDGVLFSASDSSLIGAELVGWLIDSETTEPTILPTWIQGSRAVLVDRARGRYIIVTSTARVVSEVHVDGSNDLRHGSNVTHLPPSERPDGSFARQQDGSVARRASTLASETSGARKTPVPAPRPIPPCPPSPSRKITLSGSLIPSGPAEVRTSSPPPAPSSPMFGAAVSRGPAMSAPPPTTIPDSPPLPRPMVHPPPRPIRRSPAPPPPPSGANIFPPPQAHLAARPLPLPLPPPMRPMANGYVPTRIAPPMSAPPPSVSIDDVDPTQRHDRRALPLSAPRVPASPPSAPIPLAQRRVTP